MGDEFVRHQGGLLVPADAVAWPPTTGEAAEKRAQLAAARNLQAVQREDAWAQRATAADHEMAMADVNEQTAAARRARRERARDTAEADGLTALYRRATLSGARARVRTQIQGSAEMRALRIAKVRTVALVVGIPVLLAFAAWSTTGVQAGFVRLLKLESESASWWASWAVEPALIVIVAMIIIGRAVLRSSGGDTDWRATVAEWTALGASLALNVFGGWHGGWEGLGTALPHAIGPIGAAGTAFLIGLFDGYTATARPWEGALSLAELDLVPPAVPVSATVASVPVPVAVPGRAVAGSGRPRPVPVVGTGTPVPKAVPGRAATGPGRPRPVPVAGTSQRALVGRTGPGERSGAVPVPGSAKAAARAFWDFEAAAGRVPTGAELARAAGKDNDETGVFRRYARDWAAEQSQEVERDAAAS